MASIKSSTRLYGGANISVRKTFMLGIKRPSSRCLSSNIHHPSAVTELLQAWEVGHNVKQREADSSCQWTNKSHTKSDSYFDTLLLYCFTFSKGS